MIVWRSATAAAIAALAMPVTASGTVGIEAPAKIATADFARRAPFHTPRISPDGAKLLIQTTKDDKPMVGVQDLATGALQLMSPAEDGEIAWARWAGNDRILISIASSVPWLDGEEARQTRLVVYDVSTRQSRFIGGRAEGLEGDDVLYVDPAGDWILLSIQRTIYDYPSVYRFDLANNARKLVVPAQAPVWEWFADGQGVVRAGIGFLDQIWVMMYRKAEKDAFRQVGKVRYDDRAAELDILRILQDSDEGYVLSNDKTGRYALYKYNFAKRELGELILESPTNDIAGFDLTDDGKTLNSAFYTDDRPRVVWFDQDMKRHQEKIEKVLLGRMNHIISRARDNERMVVWTGSVRDPGSYYIYAPGESVMKRFGRVNDQLEVKRLADTRYVSYKARDGLEIPAYLTLPVNRDPKDLPLIILPHGGPFGVRDSFQYDAEVQFLANRGYAVLQPNYRGSESYGKAFYEKGQGEWGRKMQDDLDDGMDWLVASGTVDAKRVCIVGSSYGGYAALWGVTRNPERYRCAASFAGVTDLRRQLNYQTDFLINRRYRKNWRTTVRGQKDFDLDSVSPLKQVDRLKAPVLLGHGDKDSRVPYKQSVWYAAALKKAGKPYEFRAYEGEGHGFSKADNLKDWLDRLETFLAKHNPAD